MQRSKLEESNDRLAFLKSLSLFFRMSKFSAAYYVPGIKLNLGMLFQAGFLSKCGTNIWIINI